VSTVYPAPRQESVRMLLILRGGGWGGKGRELPILPIIL
jgi:hypothetical protein